MGSIYDEAWASLAAGYAQADGATREGARAELAAIMLRLAERQLGSNDLKDKALRIFRRALSGHRADGVVSAAGSPPGSLIAASSHIQRAGAFAVSLAGFFAAAAEAGVFALAAGDGAALAAHRLGFQIGQQASSSGTRDLRGVQAARPRLAAPMPVPTSTT